MLTETIWLFSLYRRQTRISASVHTNFQHMSYRWIHELITIHGSLPLATHFKIVADKNFNFFFSFFVIKHSEICMRTIDVHPTRWPTLHTQLYSFIHMHRIHWKYCIKCVCVMCVCVVVSL